MYIYIYQVCISICIIIYIYLCDFMCAYTMRRQYGSWSSIASDLMSRLLALQWMMSSLVWTSDHDTPASSDTTEELTGEAKNRRPGLCTLILANRSRFVHACGAECLLDSCRAENPKQSYGFRLNQESSKPPDGNVLAFASRKRYSFNSYPRQ